MNKGIDVAGRFVPCRLATAEVLTVKNEPDETMTLVMRDGNDDREIKLLRGHALEVGERITTIELEDRAARRWVLIAVACHGSRTWFFNGDPVGFLTQSGLLRRHPSKLEVALFSIIGAACLVATLSGVYALALTPVLLPITLYQGREFVLRRKLYRQLERMFTTLDILARDAIGPQKRESYFTVSATLP